MSRPKVATAPGYLQNSYVETRYPSLPAGKRKFSTLGASVYTVCLLGSACSSSPPWALLGCHGPGLMDPKWPGGRFLLVGIIPGSGM